MIALNLPKPLFPGRFAAGRPLPSLGPLIHALRRLATAAPRDSRPLRDAATPPDDLAAATWEDAEWQ